MTNRPAPLKNSIYVGNWINGAGESLILCSSPPRSFPTSPNRASLKFESKNFSSELIGVGMSRPIVVDRQAHGGPEYAPTHFPNVLKAQLQVRIHSLKVNPVAIFAYFPVHRPPVDDRPAISSFPVD
ncbi:hypothetical protein AYI70_g1132 [Smittium culicis]|uniref:Uncharacterized protein n=1 Tax=Smittium culicis TaxID=133412 RepID=A0A1R1YDW0_9FUNG|nr:hypothetical protein AYI70_g1132 [Smittium culicis]